MDRTDDLALPAELDATPERQRLPPDDPYSKSLPALRYAREVIERALYEVAFQAGNTRKAQQALAALGIHVPYRTMHDWVRGRFRNRYQEIATQATDELRERIARDTIDLAAGEKEALRQTLAGLADLNAVEASMVLRNLSTSKGINLDQEGKLRGRAGVVVDHRGFEDLAEALLRLGTPSASSTPRWWRKTLPSPPAVSCDG